MNRIKAILCLVLLCSLGGPVPKLWAYWVEDGAPISTVQGIQQDARITSDGSGGAILAWVDLSSGIGTIHVQGLDASGAAQWAMDGIPLNPQGRTQSSPRITSDGSGGAIVAWQEYGLNGWDIFAQRMGPDGTTLWPAGGVPISEGISVQVDCQIIADGIGGAIVTWRDMRAGENDVYAQRINSAGTVKWVLDGVPVCDARGDQWFSQVISDGAGGAIVTWRDFRTDENDIYVQRLNSLGATMWTPDGEPLCTVAGDQDRPQITSDGVGGAIVTWQDSRTGEYDIYGQRIDASGTVKWAADGVLICRETGDQNSAQITADGLGGGIVTWSDFRTLSYDIYAQRIDALGTAMWTTDGVPLCTAAGNQQNPRITSDGVHGAIVTWSDISVDKGIGAQRINSLGSTQWVADGVILCAAPSWQNYPKITSDGAGGAIVAWTDERISFADDDIYAQQVDAQGRVGRVLPAIHSAGDVPGDNGGWLNLTWDASLVDYRMGEITEYTVWRALATPVALGMIESGTGDTPTLRSAPLNGEMFYWELIWALNPYRLQGYSVVVPTLFDSTAVVTDFHYFQVMAHTNDPAVFYISEPDSGYSVDNLAPSALFNLAGQQIYGPEGLQMTWAPNTESDLAGYRVYRGSDPDFDTDAAHLLATVPDTTMTDWGWDQSLGYHYKVAAVDIHENLGPPALLVPDGVSGVGSQVPGLANSLAQNHPNPFNPSTRLSFEIVAPGHTRLKVYDAAGRLVSTLVDETLDAGRHDVIWDGRDEKGRMSSAGVYLYRLEIGNYVKTKRMTLIK